MATSTHRKNQIVASHVANQAAERCHPEDMDLTQLHNEVTHALQMCRRTAIGDGHIDNAARCARALKCVEEMWNRGVQLHLEF